MKYDIIVVGGGAAGMFVSSLLSRKKKKVLLLEKNKNLGKKLLITGKGRCNLTNNSSPEEILKNIPVNFRFLYSAINTFNAQDTMDYFEKLNVPLKTERGNRVFPVSDRAGDIVHALEKDLHKNGVTIKNSAVTSINVENGVATGVKCGKDSFFADKVIVATGGKSYPLTGSTGDGYKFATEVGHTVTKLTPSLVPLVTKEKYPAEIMGLSLKNVTLTLREVGKKKPVYSELGEMLFTHFGVSGPLVLSASSHIQKFEEGKFSLEIDLKSGLSEKQLDDRILRDFAEYQGREIQNVLTKLLPTKLIPIIMDLSEIKEHTKVNDITKIQRGNLVNVIKKLTLQIKGFRPIEEAIITSGGVAVKEINPKNMESKLVQNLYFIGEILDVDAYTGGFNLQIAFSTAFLAYKDICEQTY